MKPIDLYVIPPSPPCRAVIIAAKYMQINVNLIYVDLMKGEQKQDWFVKMNPQHCLPTINDNGFVLWESRSIMTYMANQYAPSSPIYPSEAASRALVDRMLQFDLNVLYRSFGEFLIPIVRENKKLANLNPTKERRVEEALSYLESVLAENAYVAGSHLTLADFSIYYSMEFTDELKYDFSKFKHIAAWYRRMQVEIFAIDQKMHYNVIRSVCNSADYANGNNGNNCNNSSSRSSSSSSGSSCSSSNSNNNNAGTSNATCDITAPCSDLCNLDKVCVEGSGTGDGSGCTKVICRESDNCKVVTNYSTKQAENQSSKSLFDLLMNTSEKLFESPK